MEHLEAMNRMVAHAESARDTRDFLTDLRALY